MVPLQTCLPIYFSNGKKNILDKKDFNRNQFYSEKQKLLKVISLRNALSQENYQVSLIQFISMHEGCSLMPYLCPGDVVTLGYGLALRFSNGRISALAKRVFVSLNLDIEQYLSIFDKDNQDERLRITEEMSYDILNAILMDNLIRIEQIVPFFHELEWNLQITLHSLYFHSPSYIKGFLLQNLTKYYETSNDKYLLEMLYFICYELNEAPYYLNLNTKSKIEDVARLGKKIFGKLKEYYLDFLERFEAEDFGQDNLSKNSNISYYWRGVQFRRYREMLMMSNSVIDSEFFPEIV